MKTFTFLFFATICLNLFSQQVKIKGTVKLKNQSDYTGVLVIFNQLSPNVSTDTVYSDSGGGYSIMADQGLYDIFFYKKGFDRVTYKSIQAFSDKTLLDTTLSLHRTYLAVPADFDSVYKAVNYAVSGDTIIISEGVYKEKITINKKGITIASKYFEDHDTTHFSKTILSGGGNKQIMNISSEGETNKIIGITFTDGYSTHRGGAIQCLGNLMISNCRFLNNRVVSNSNETGEGGAIYINGGELNAYNSKFIKCSTSTAITVDGAAAGAVLTQGTTASFVKCDFIENTTLYWGGAVQSYCTTTFDSCSFIRNKSAGSAGAIFFAGGKAYLSIKNSNFTENAGKLIVCSWNNLGYHITNTLFKKNPNCVFDIYNSKGIAENCIFTENAATKGSIISDSDNLFRNCQFTYNTAATPFVANFSNCILYKNVFANKSSTSKVINSSIYPKSQISFSDPLIGLLVKKNANKDSCDFYNNIITDPSFIDTISFTPSATSTLIDAGKNEGNLISIDFLGNHRIFDGNTDSIANVDIGPYEVKSSVVKQQLLPLGKDIVKCIGDSVDFSVPEGCYKSVWLNDTTYGDSRKIVKPGNYYIQTLKDGFLLYSDTLVVSENQLPTVEITKTFVSDTIVKLQTTNSYVSYLWNDTSNNSSISIPKSKFISNEVYSWVYITDDNNCRNSDTIKLFKADFPKALGILEGGQIENGEIKIFPLPAFEKIFIKYPEASNEILYITIYDLAGKLVFSKNFPGSKEISFDISTLKSGNYIICLRQGIKNISRYMSKQ